MRLAVGAYSGPRTVCGAVAQLAKNARHVIRGDQANGYFCVFKLHKRGQILR